MNAAGTVGPGTVFALFRALCLMQVNWSYRDAAEEEKERPSGGRMSGEKNAEVKRKVGSEEWD